MLQALSELFTERNQDSKFIQYDGDYDFWVEPIIEGSLPYETATIIIRCRSQESDGHPINFHCKWFRVVNGVNHEIPDSDGCDFYNLTPYDIGCSICCCITYKEAGAVQVARVVFGAIESDPCLKPMLEHHLLSSEGSFRFSLVRFGDVEVTDLSDFGNVIEFRETQLGVRFGDTHEEFRDFSVDLLGTKGIELRCDFFDPRRLTIYFKKGEEEFIAQSILLGKPNKTLGQSKSKFPYSEMMSMENDGKSEFLRKAENAKGLVNVEASEAVDLESMFSLVIKFESRLLRDAFVTALRFMVIQHRLPMNEVKTRMDLLLRSCWFPQELDENSQDYIKATFELHAFRAILNRMLRINKSLVLEYDTLMDVIGVLDNDFKFTVGEFDDLIENLKSKMKDEGGALEGYEDLKKNLADTSQYLDNLKRNASNMSFLKNENKEEKKEKVDPQTVNKMEKELESRKKLNKMLMKEINKLKSPEKGGSGRKRGNKQKAGDKTFNLLPENPFSADKRLNRSLIGREKDQDKYLIGLEEDLKAIQSPAKDTKAEQQQLAEKETIENLEGEIKELDSQINIADKCYEEMVDIAQRIKQGEDFEEIKGIISEEARNKLTAGDPKDLEIAELKRFINSRLNQNQNNLLKDKDIALGESNVLNAFGDSQFETPGFAQVSSSNDTEVEEFLNKRRVLKEDLDRGRTELDQYKEDLSELVKELEVMKNEEGADEPDDEEIEKLMAELKELELENEVLEQEKAERELEAEMLQAAEDEDEDELGGASGDEPLEEGGEEPLEKLEEHIDPAQEDQEEDNVNEGTLEDNSKEAIEEGEEADEAGEDEAGEEVAGETEEPNEEENQAQSQEEEIEAFSGDEPISETEDPVAEGDEEPVAPNNE